MNDEPKPTESTPEELSAPEDVAEDETAAEGEDKSGKPKRAHGPTPYQRAWLQRGLDAPKSKLPMFDQEGGEIDSRCIQACLENGWAEPWFANPLNPEMHICRLTEKGRVVALKQPKSRLSEGDIED